MKDIRELEKCMRSLCNVNNISMGDDEISTTCALEISYEDDMWAVWLTDESGSGHPAAEAYRYIEGEMTDEVLNVGMGYHFYYGDCENIFGDRGETLEEAVTKLAAKVAILQQNPDYCLVFTWDD